MSQESPNNQEFIPPPVDESPFEPRTIKEKTESVRKTIIWAFALSFISLPWVFYMLLVFPPYYDFPLEFHIVLRAFLSLIASGMMAICAYGLSNGVVQTIDYYGVSRNIRPAAVIAKLISLGTVLLWVVGLIVVVFWWRSGILYQIGFQIVEMEFKQ